MIDSLQSASRHEQPLQSQTIRDVHISAAEVEKRWKIARAYDARTPDGRSYLWSEAQVQDMFHISGTYLYGVVLPFTGTPKRTNRTYAPRTEHPAHQERSKSIGPVAATNAVCAEAARERLDPPPHRQDWRRVSITEAQQIAQRVGAMVWWRPEASLLEAEQYALVPASPQFA